MTSKSELVSWLQSCFKKDLTDLRVDNLRYTEKGTGFIGDVIFACVTGKTKNSSTKQYDVVLKCSKASKLLRETSPSKTLFLNEIYFYETVLPAFTKFQLDHGVKNPFNSFPHYYGSFVGDQNEVLVLEDLSAKGYDLWDRNKPMTRKHLDLVVGQYAKFHAISVAMQNQFLEEYQALVKPLNKVFEEFERLGNKMLLNFLSCIEDAYQVLKDDLDKTILSKWRNFGKFMETDCLKLHKEAGGLKVVNHGDCWNNNFLFQNEEDDSPKKLSIIDWQITKLATPVSDLSHFLFASISADDLEDIDGILNYYYGCFSDYLLELKTDPEVYSRKQFLEDWKKYSKFGLMLTPMTVQVCIRDIEDVVDMAEAADQGDFTETFRMKLKNKTLFRSRMMPVVKYAVENNLI